ncbi:hypothetical protein EC988_005669 [Linderina pennispora]|nr:hypothetical protein EC988_005669 [Linderina pennispora]
MAPGRPRAHLRRHPSNIRQAARSTSTGIPSYLFDSYERLFNDDQPRPLLIDAATSRTFTYELLRSHCVWLATALHTHLYLGREQLVGVLAPSGIDLPVIALATWMAGGTLMPLVPEATAAELAVIVDQARSMPHTFFVTGSLAGKIVQLVAEQSATLPNIVIIDDTPVEDSGGAPCFGLQELYRVGQELPPVSWEQWDRQRGVRDRSAIMYFQYHVLDDGEVDVTAAPVDHGSVINLYMANRPPTLRADSPAYSVLRMHSAFRTHIPLFDVLCSGAQYVIARTFDPGLFSQSVAQHGLLNAELTYNEIAVLLQTH